MRDGRLEPRNLLRIGLVTLAGMLMSRCILYWHTSSGHGLRDFQWDRLLLQALGATGLLICVWLVGRGKETITLGIGKSTSETIR
jgi:hypothetical protein